MEPRLRLVLRFGMDKDDRQVLDRQMQFVVEAERLKTVYRQNMVVDGSRYESAAEHSWHVALMALLLVDHARDAGIDLLAVITMLLVHDIVEIDAGDTCIYDEAANLDKSEREREAAERIFGLLPPAQRDRLIGLWQEFEARDSVEAKLAAALDSMQPVVNAACAPQLYAGTNRPAMSRVVEKKRHIEDAAPALWEYTREIIRHSAAAGLYSE